MIKIGTSGFSFPDWMGAVYPKNLQPKDALSYYEQELRFNCVEINFTYYTLPGIRTMEGMVKKTSEKFEFVVKGNRIMTHDPFDSRLAKRPEKEEVQGAFKKFKDSLQPLMDSNKLGAVLLQFPVFFCPSRENRDYILRAKESLSPAPVVIEFRNKAWVDEINFRFLKENELSYCAVDEPKISRLMPFIGEVTSPPAYLRFHGRNVNWFNVPTSERYDYLYSDDELREFVPEIGKMEKRAWKTYIFFNNCHKGQAVRNGLRMKDLLGLIEKTSVQSKEMLKKIFEKDRQGELF